MAVMQQGSPTKADMQACCPQMEAGGGLLVRLDKNRAGVPRTAAAVAARWFSQDIFSGPGLAEDDAAHASASAQPSAGALMGPRTEWCTHWYAEILFCNAACEDYVHARGIQENRDCCACLAVDDKSLCCWVLQGLVKEQMTLRRTRGMQMRV